MLTVDITKAVDGEIYTLQSATEFDNSLLKDRGLKVTEVSYDGWFSVFEELIGLRLEIKFKLEGPCDSCVTPTVKTKKTKISASFSKTPIEDCYTYSGNSFDFQEALNQAIILCLPSRFLCKEDCKGICPQCGANLNVDECLCEKTEIGQNNPFYILKFNAGGAGNGITKKKDF